MKGAVVLMVIGTILSPSLTTPSAGKLTDFIPRDGMCGLTTEERIEVIRNVQNAGGVAVPECGPGTWFQIANIDVTSMSTQCPFPWELVTSPNGCRKMDEAPGCGVATFRTVVEYGKVCGRIIGDTIGFPDSFNGGSAATATDGIRLIDGVTITHSSPIQHIWTFSGSQGIAVNGQFTCACNTAAPTNTGAVDFAEDDYFCDTTAERIKNLWGGDCDGLSPDLQTCCEFNNPPFFTATLPTRTSANVDVHLCRDQFRSDEDILVLILELYVQ